MQNISINDGLRGGDNADRTGNIPVQVHPDDQPTSRSGDPRHQTLSLGQSSSGDERVNTGITHDDEGFRNVLAELWNSVAKPVVDCLDLQVSNLFGVCPERPSLMRLSYLATISGRTWPYLVVRDWAIRRSSSPCCRPLSHSPNGNFLCLLRIMQFHRTYPL